MPGVMWTRISCVVFIVVILGCIKGLTRADILYRHGCVEVSELDTLGNNSLKSNRPESCLKWCKAQQNPTQYIALKGEQCLCVNNVTNVTTRGCTDPCPLNVTAHYCGNTLTGVFSLYKIDYNTSARSDDLCVSFNCNLTTVRYENCSTKYRVFCVDDITYSSNPPLSTIPTTLATTTVTQSNARTTTVRKTTPSQITTVAAHATSTVMKTTKVQLFTTTGITSTSTTGSSGGKISVATIVGICIGLLLVLLLIIVICIVLWKKKKRQRQVGNTDLNQEQKTSSSSDNAPATVDVNAPDEEPKPSSLLATSSKDLDFGRDPFRRVAPPARSEPAYASMTNSLPPITKSHYLTAPTAKTASTVIGDSKLVALDQNIPIKSQNFPITKAGSTGFAIDGSEHGPMNTSLPKLSSLHMPVQGPEKPVLSEVVFEATEQPLDGTAKKKKTKRKKKKKKKNYDGEHGSRESAKDEKVESVIDKGYYQTVINSTEFEDNDM